jgi:regulator of replication initiation timing
MTNTERIKALEDQLKELQSQLDNLKNNKLEVVRSYTGEIFSPYEGNQYRRLLSDDIPIWEQFNSSENTWILMSEDKSDYMESIYKTEY